jgi:hypothetical protein
MRSQIFTLSLFLILIATAGWAFANYSHWQGIVTYWGDAPQAMNLWLLPVNSHLVGLQKYERVSGYVVNYALDDNNLQITIKEPISQNNIDVLIPNKLASDFSFHSNDDGLLEYDTVDLDVIRNRIINAYTTHKIIIIGLNAGDLDTREYDEIAELILFDPTSDENI